MSFDVPPLVIHVILCGIVLAQRVGGGTLFGCCGNSVYQWFQNIFLQNLWAPEINSVDFDITTNLKSN